MFFVFCFDFIFYLLEVPLYMKLYRGEVGSVTRESYNTLGILISHTKYASSFVLSDGEVGNERVASVRTSGKPRRAQKTNNTIFRVNSLSWFFTFCTLVSFCF